VCFRYGPNALTPPKKPGFFAKLWAQLNNVLIFILLAAAVVVAGLQEWCVPFVTNNQAMQGLSR
jgi:magnesium-transporting ATPase (P-type)